MKKLLLSFAAAALTIGFVALAKGPSKPEVLMTVAGKPVTLNEFEYLFHKNNSQQMAPQTVDEYLDMFITYKQKVAAAEAEGIDQTEAFQKEFDGYRRDLADPYLTDQTVTDSILHALYERMKTERDVSHIMLPLRTPAADGTRQQQLLDSLRTAILNGADFEAVARQYSADRAVQRNGGHMGFLPAGRVPYTFEDAAYSTPIGQISPVIATPFGYHIVKVNGERPASGQVLVEHILKLTQGLPPEEAAAKKAQIDSIYNVVIAQGADFEDVARRESEDPGSAKNGGRLPWFGAGQMVPEFEQTAFALDSAAISQPFATSYGYHIVRKLGSKGLDSFENLEPTLKNAIKNDERGQMGRQRRLQQLEREMNATLDNEAIAALRAEILANGALDSALTAAYANSPRVVARVNGHDITLAEVMEFVHPNPAAPADNHAAMLEGAARHAFEEAVLEQARENLAQTNPDYANLLNEYRDGILLFEISDRNVWSAAKKNPQGLEDFFNANRAKYTWSKPKFKSYVIFANSDSVMQLAQGFLQSHEVANDSLVQTLRRNFGNNVKVEKVIAAQGENPIIDHIAFQGARPAPKGKWAFYFPYKGRIIPAPEEAADERGQVTTDYQAALEAAWVADLHNRFPAKVNKKVLKKAH